MQMKEAKAAMEEKICMKEPLSKSSNVQRRFDERARG